MGILLFLGLSCRFEIFLNKKLGKEKNNYKQLFFPAGLIFLLIWLD